MASKSCRTDHHDRLHRRCPFCLASQLEFPRSFVHYYLFSKLSHSRRPAPICKSSSTSLPGLGPTSLSLFDFDFHFQFDFVRARSKRIRARHPSLSKSLDAATKRVLLAPFRSRPGRTLRAPALIPNRTWASGRKPELSARPVSLLVESHFLRAPLCWPPPSSAAEAAAGAVQWPVRLAGPLSTPRQGIQSTKPVSSYRAQPIENSRQATIVFSGPSRPAACDFFA